MRKLFLVPGDRVFLFVPKWVWGHSGSPELGGLGWFCGAGNQGESCLVCEAEKSVRRADPFLAHPRSLKSIVLISVASPVLAGEAEAEGAPSSCEVVAAVESGIRGAETLRINLSGTQIGESASCGKTQAYPRPLVNNESGPFHCPERRSFHLTNGFAFNCSGHQWRSIAVDPAESAFKIVITKRACCTI